MHIYLTGFMGAGKSHDGRRLAEALNRPFIDLDDRIEAAARQSISSIFAEHGADFFRQLEAATLRSLATENPAVVATGGGAPCFHDNMAWMNAHGTTIFLDPPETTLVARLEKGRAHRPLLQDADALPEFIASKLASRRADYELAQIHFAPTDETEDAVRFILQQLQAKPLQ
ncbi:MAG: shikimate kinase [Bacteroidota bacterium]